MRVYVATTFVDPAPTRNPNPYPVVLIERVDATVHITPCSSNMAPDPPIMLNHRGAQHHYWTLQIAEDGVFLAGALVLLVLALVAVRRWRT